MGEGVEVMADRKATGSATDLARERHEAQLDLAFRIHRVAHTPETSERFYFDEQRRRYRAVMHRPDVLPAEDADPLCACRKIARLLAPSESSEAEVARLSLQLTHERLTTEDALRRTADYAVQVDRLSLQLHEALQRIANLTDAYDLRGRRLAIIARVTDPLACLYCKQALEAVEAELGELSFDVPEQQLAETQFKLAAAASSLTSLSSQLAGLREKIDALPRYGGEFRDYVRLADVVAALHDAQTPPPAPKEPQP